MNAGLSGYKKKKKKGSDRTTIQLQETANADEVRHLQGRYKYRTLRSYLAIV